MNILVIGGAGYVGSTLVSHILSDTGHSVQVLDRMDYPVDRDWYFEVLHNKRARFAKDDFRSVDIIYPMVKDCDVVVNLAALVGEPVCQKRSTEAIMSNEVMVKMIGHMCNLESKRLVFLSTCSNYGKSDGLVDEESQLFPVSIYAITKVNAEQYVRRSVSNAAILRCATAYGVSAGRMRWDLLLNDLVYSAHRDRRIEVYNPGAYRPLCHVEDICRAVVLAAERPSAGSAEVFNIGDGGQNYTKQEIADRVAELVPARVEVVETDDKRDYRVDFSRARSVLGFRAERDVDHGIRTMSDALRRGAIATHGSNV